ncbi:hypothetical protein HP572_07395 [Pectobacterium sp. PL64]|uniref:hypothetical protein n=1 Tax=Pectobacterium sp. PL64 TaxID=2738983 RepID=UPI001F0C9DAF|nr:hypothetical protein [Pectobacterium sp. PL64]UMO89338.1 hypothetical protein HP572_07395 [Pectobacterium sp. PL64]
MKNESSSIPNGYVAIGNNMGYFTDQKKFAQVASLSDEAAATVKITLIHENFLNIYIENIRKPGTESFVKPTRYFMPKIELSVALGLPVSLANALLSFNSIRNKFAHNIDHEISSSDIDLIIKTAETITVKEINYCGALNTEIVSSILDDGVYSVTIMKNIPYSTSIKQKNIIKLSAAAYYISIICAMFMVNELHYRGILELKTP